MALPASLRPIAPRQPSPAEIERKAQMDHAIAMLRAAQDGDVLALKTALATPEGAKNAFSSDAGLGFSCSLLHEAISNDHGECALALIPHSDLSATNKNGLTPLLAALCEGIGAHADYAAAFAMLAGSDASVVDEYGNTALIYAASLDHPKAAELVQRILPQSDVSRMNRYGMSALLLAAKSGAAGTLQLLAPLADSQAIDPFGHTAFLLAAKHAASPALLERVKIIAPFSDCRVVNHAEKNALALACERHFAPAIEFLLPLVDWRQGAGQHANVFDFAVADKSWDCADAIAFHAETHGQTVPRLREVVSRSKKELFPKSRALIEAQDLRHEMDEMSLADSALGRAASGPSAVIRRPPRAL